MRNDHPKQDTQKQINVDLNRDMTKTAFAGGLMFFLAVASLEYKPLRPCVIAGTLIGVLAVFTKSQIYQQRLEDLSSSSPTETEL